MIMRRVVGLGSSLLLGAALIVLLVGSFSKPASAHCKQSGPHSTPEHCNEPEPPGGEDGVIRLEATFRDGANDYGISDNVLSDGQGPYVSVPHKRSVEITEEGNFRFTFPIVSKRKLGSGRSIVLEFNDRLDDIDGLPFDPCGNGGPCPPDPDLEPVNGIFVQTNGFWGGEPMLNFQLMVPGAVGLVKLFIEFNTTERSGFRLRFDPERTNLISTKTHGGIVQVTACPAPEGSQPEVELACEGATDTDGLVDRWVLVPVPETADSRASLVIHTDTGKEGHQVIDFGDFRMPFLLTLDRID